MKIVQAAGQREYYLNKAPHIVSDGTMFFTHLGIRWRAMGAAPAGAMSRTPPKELLDKAKVLAELTL